MWYTAVIDAIIVHESVRGAVPVAVRVYVRNLCAAVVFGGSDFSFSCALIQQFNHGRACTNHLTDGFQYQPNMVHGDLEEFIAIMEVVSTAIVLEHGQGLLGNELVRVCSFVGRLRRTASHIKNLKIFILRATM